MVTALSVVGTLLMLFGLWGGYRAFNFDTAIGDTANLSLMQQQTIGLGISATAFLAGCIFLVGACLCHALMARRD